MIGGRRRTLLVLATGLLASGCLGREDAGAQASDRVDDLLREGRYADAVAALEAAVPEGAPPARVLLLAGVLLETARYERAEAVLRSGRAVAPEDASLALALARVLLETGRIDDATRVFEEVHDAGGADGLEARLMLGEILLLRGETDAALEAFDGFIDVYNRAASLGSRELLAVGTAVRRLGVRSPPLFQDALKAYDEAVAADPSHVEAHLAIGELFLEKYNVPDARAAFREVLERRAAHPRALLGLARASELEGTPDALVRVNEALEVAPDLVEARVLRARLHLAGEDGDAADADLARALEVNPASSAALGVLAGARLLRGDRHGYAEVRDRALALNPNDASFFATAAELVARGRLYALAAELAGEGAALDPTAWSALGLQGLNQLRIGAMEDGRGNLERAFRGDPYHVWSKNTLDLLDAMDTFEEWEGSTVRVFVDPEDGEALAVYLVEVAERAYGDLAERYGHRPPAPVRVEAFRRSADFSVRTVGLTGLGALGVSFGPVIAMESPANRGRDGAHWASTLWHEMAHTVHLSATDHRVPRWFTEGLAVREERRAGSGWGARPSLPFLAAYTSGGLRAPSELSLSFIRPRSPDEVGHAYVLGSLVTEWIEERWGFAGIQGVLEAYREGLGPDEVLARELGLDADGFDAQFDAWFRDRHARPLDATEATLAGREVAPPDGDRGPAWWRVRLERDADDLEARLSLGRHLLEAGRVDEALPHLEAARELFPENPDPRGPHRLLADVHGSRGDAAAEAVALESHLAHQGADYDAHLALAGLREVRGDRAGAAEALEAAVLVYPFDLDVHRRLADLYRELGEAAREVRERRVVLAMEPADRVGALQALAEAHFRAGDVESAREHVLRALELAPRFPAAQDLLLRIVEGRPPS